MHRELVRLRREDPTVAGAIRGQAGVAFDGAVIGPACFVLRLWRSDGPDSRPDDDDRLLVVNLGVELRYSPCPEPLVAPPPGRRWQPIFATEDARWSGCGVPQPETEDDGWVIPAESALLLAPAALEGASDGRG
jgi:maltooligosyltrehalose trehalohydrolase